MRIAFMGTRGVPAEYSGFETFVEQLGSRLASRGHDVTVYGRRHHAHSTLQTYLGMHLRPVHGIATKHLDTISHTFASLLDLRPRRYDVVVMCISGNSPLAWIPRLFGAKVVLNVDGSDWRREKWGRWARRYLHLSEWLSTYTPDATVTDSRVMQRYYLERFGVETECIVYGADVHDPVATGILERFNLRPRGYFLLVARLVPENCAHHLVQAFERMDTDLQCVVVGDAPYERDYIRRLHVLGPHVKFPGYVFGDGYRELMLNAYATVMCSEVGGTHPVLVEAMAAGNCVVVNDIPANLEVIDGAGFSYDGDRGDEALLPVLQQIEADPVLVGEMRERARMRARSQYSWETVTDEYESLFNRLVTGRSRAAAASPSRDVE